MGLYFKWKMVFYCAVIAPKEHEQTGFWLFGNKRLNKRRIPVGKIERRCLKYAKHNISIAI
jgi:hypothetical protein